MGKVKLCKNRGFYRDIVKISAYALNFPVITALLLGHGYLHRVKTYKLELQYLKEKNRSEVNCHQVTSGSRITSAKVCRIAYFHACFFGY